MWRARLIYLGLGALLLGTTALASAEEFSIVEGEFTDAATLESTALTGVVDLAPPGTPISDDVTLYSIDDFDLKLGAETFKPRGAIEYDGQHPLLFLHLADQMSFGANRVGGFYARSGGELVEVSGNEVTFRFFDFVSSDASDSSISGPLPGLELPRRFHLEGTLQQVDQTFRVSENFCLPVLDLPPRPPVGGGTIVIGGGNLTLHEFESFDLSGDDTVLLAPSIPGAGVIARSSENESSIDGGLIRLAPGAELILLNPESVFSGGSLTTRVSPLIASTTNDAFVAAAEVLEVPTLEELNISAPDGAEILFDDDGVLTVESDGAITLFGPLPEIPGLTEIRIVAGGDILVTEDFEFRSDISLSLYTDASIEIDGDLTPPLPPEECSAIGIVGLRRLVPVETTVLGTFSITASAATQVAIDVSPGHKSSRLRLDRRDRVRVALLGSDDLDVRDVDPETLRLGPANAHPIAGPRGPRVRMTRANRDRRRDLFTVFDVRELGLAYGDSELCLHAQTYSGETIEGCDRIDTTPRGRRSPKQD
jgi:filamentous hemagglutinin family protein